MTALRYFDEVLQKLRARRSPDRQLDEARIREIIREEIDADRPRTGLTGDEVATAFWRHWQQMPSSIQLLALEARDPTMRRLGRASCRLLLAIVGFGSLRGFRQKRGGENA